MHLADIAISLLYSSKHHLFAALPISLSLAVIVGGVYGLLRLIIDVVRLLTGGFMRWMDSGLDPKYRKDHSP